MSNALKYPVVSLEDFTSFASEKLRYSDTDRQGHINNTVFFVLLEAGRVNLLFESGLSLNAAGTEFVLAKSTVNFVGQLHWPGQVEVATRVEKLGNSSIVLTQALFQQGACAATAESVMVLVDAVTGKPHPLSQDTRDFLQELSLSSQTKPGRK